VIGLGALTVMRRFERKDDGTVRRRLAVTTTGGPASLAAIRAAVLAQGCIASDVEYESAPEDGRLTVTFDLQVPDGAAADPLLHAVERQPGVARVRLSAND
jgi:hypothetical protein